MTSSPRAGSHRQGPRFGIALWLTPSSIGLVSEILSLCHGVPEVTYQSGETVILEGDPTPKLVILKEGAVEILRGDFTIASVDEPGAIFGEISVILRRPHSATVRAFGQATFHVVDNPDSFLWQQAEVNFHIMRMLAERLVAVNEHLVDASRKSDVQDQAMQLLLRKMQGATSTAAG